MNPQAEFELVSDGIRPVAAIIPQDITGPQCNLIYRLLPSNAVAQFDLAERWEVSSVLSDPEWAAEQRHRRPMLKPKGVKLVLLQQNEPREIPSANPAQPALRAR